MRVNRPGAPCTPFPRTPASTLTTVTQSSPYRFKTLMERARQLVAKTREQPEALAKLVSAEVAKWTPLIRAAGVAAE